MTLKLTNQINKFKAFLVNKELGKKTVSSYSTDVKNILEVVLEKFTHINDVVTLTKEMIIYAKEEIFESRTYAPATLKRRRHGWNAFCDFLGRDDLKINKKIKGNNFFNKKMIQSSDVYMMIDFCRKQLSHINNDLMKVLWLRKMIALSLGVNEGLRVSEYKNVKFSDVENKIIVIINSKHGNFREVMLTEKTAALISELYELFYIADVLQKHEYKTQDFCRKTRKRRGRLPKGKLGGADDGLRQKDKF